jgi:hypothetical protein
MRDAHAVSVLLAARIGELVCELLPNGRDQGGTWRVGGLDGNKGGSLAIALLGDHQGRWRDFATRERGDALDLVKGVLGYDTPQALIWSRRWLDRCHGEARAPAHDAGGGDDEGRRIEIAQAIFDEAIDPRHTYVDTYLFSRGLQLDEALADHVIRYHRACPWGRDAIGNTIRGPAMVVAMRSIATDEITAIHRTLLSPDAEKIERRMLGVAAGAAVKLDADETVTDRLTIGEGIETCMTARQIGLRPTWALGSAGAIAAFPVLDGVESLRILGERDEASKRARAACGARWYNAGREVLLNHSRAGKDLNDGLQAAPNAVRGRRIKPHDLSFEATFRPARSTVEHAGGAGDRFAGEAGAISEADLPPVAAGQPPRIVDEAEAAPNAQQLAIALRSGGAEAVSETGLPEIQVAAGQLPWIVDEAEAALLASGRPIFVRAGALVQPITETWPATRGRTTTIARLRTLPKASIIDLMAQSAAFVRRDARTGKLVTIDPPDKAASILLEREDAWKSPRVAGVVTTPTLRPDGSVLSSFGYDPATRLFLALDPDLKMRDIPDRPTKSDAERALGLLSDLLENFPFLGPVDRAVALAFLITPVVRGGISVAPLHLARAHTMGTGKSHLVDLAAVIASGRPCPVIAAGKNEEETEKRLGALLRDGVSIVSLDNVSADLGGDMLCQVTERPIVRVRILGLSEAPEFECKATLFATGNNVTLVGDMTRRAIVCQLDARMERPELRKFAFDPVERVLADRGTYVAAAITIARAYRMAGRPKVCPPIGSYGEWTDAVRAPLIWLGEADPVASMDALRGEDPELALIRELFAHWLDAMSLRADYTAAEIIEVACSPTPGRDGFKNPEFRDLIMRVAGDRGPPSSKSLGKWLTRINGRVVDNKRLEMRSDAKRGNRYELVKQD